MSSTLVLLSSVSLILASCVWLLKSSLTGPTVLGDGLRPPSLLISSTFHSRFKPILHSFRYPILYICIDLDCTGYVDNLFSCSEKAWRLLSLHSADYLGARHSGTIKEKLWAHLKDHGIETRTLRKVLLVTTPRLMGYAFNPVSFHYIYDVNDQLAVVVLEVNNTFGEKHIYVLDQKVATPASREDYTSRQIFPREFHVSPFNDRSGSYQLLCKDPLSDDTLNVSMHLTILEPDGSKKLTAQVSSCAAPVLTSHTAHGLWVVAKYGGAIFLTVPRILYQAKALHYAKKLGIYMRPEPREVAGAIGRQSASAADLYFADLVTRYLRTNQEWIPCSRVTFKFLHGMHEDLIIPGEGDEELCITILSMSFFSSLVTSESPLTCLWTDSLALQTPLFRVSNEVLFLKVFCAGFSRTLSGRWYLQDQRIRYRGQSDAFRTDIKDHEPSHAEFLAVTNRGFDNFAYDKALKGELSLWEYRYRVLATLRLTWLGNAIFDALATFTGEDGRPQDDWLRVQKALRSRRLAHIGTSTA